MEQTLPSCHFVPRPLATIKLWLILLTRELQTRFGQYYLGYFWMFGQPVAHVIVLSAIFSFRGREALPGIDLLMFIVTGVIPWFLFTNTTIQCSNAVNANKAFFSFQRIEVFDVLIARFLLEVFTNVNVAVCILFGAWWVGYNTYIDNFLGVMLHYGMIALLGGSLGIIISVGKSYVREVERLIPILMRPLFFISAVFFSLHDIPTQYHGYLLWNPLLHMIENIRYHYFASLHSTYASTHYAAMCTLVILCLAMLLFYTNRHRLKAQ